MNLNFDVEKIKNYKSNSQKARVLTENWVSENMYCPRCGNFNLNHFENNRPVADFFCNFCKNEYELKSNTKNISIKINDGSYETIIRRITSNKNPDFLFMKYSNVQWKVNDLIFVPKHFFVPEIIEKRKPLSQSAKRAGWVGCNILVNKIPTQGKIFIILNGKICDKDDIVNHVNISNRLITKDIKSRGWLMEILNCINLIPTVDFNLTDMYDFEDCLHKKFLNNNNIRAKIRQQLQILRDRKIIEFITRGKYRKII